jgi:hypothetical protein
MWFASYNPYGTYAYQLYVNQTRPDDGGKNGGRTYWITDDIAAEDFFVHSAAPPDASNRVRQKGYPQRMLMKFDRADYFDRYIAPLIDNFYRVNRLNPNATGAPAIFVDNCPMTLAEWSGIKDTSTWDYFKNEGEWFDGWQRVFRRIKTRFPNLKIMANWTVVEPDELADRVLEVVDHILFEGMELGPSKLPYYLAWAYRAQKMGKGVTFSYDALAGKTLDGFGLACFCTFLLTWGENSHWGGRAIDQGSALDDLPVLRRWFGAPSAGGTGTEMWEMLPGLWTRNFLNAKVFLNLSVNTYTISLSGALDNDGNTVSSVTLAPDEGRFVFRQAAAVGLTETRGQWRQLPSVWPSEHWMPASVSCDAITGSLNLGFVGENANWVMFSEEMTSEIGLMPGWSADSGTSVYAGPIWHGIRMNDVENESGIPGSTFPSVRLRIQYADELPGKYATILCYAQQTNPNTPAQIRIDSDIDTHAVFPLSYGSYPQLIRWTVQIQGSIDRFAENMLNIQISGFPESISGLAVPSGGFRMGAVRVLITEIADPEIGEYIRTEGYPLMRGGGTGIGVPLAVLSLSGYQRPGDRPSISLLNGTQIVGLASGSGDTRPALQPGDVGYQHFDTTSGKPIWWDGTNWIDAMKNIFP